MVYSEEEIECYTNILKTIPLKKPKRISCKNCGNNKHFFKERGLRYCNKCFCYWPTFIKDYTSKDRCHFQHKSIYNRSYHIKNRLEEIITKYNLDIEPEAYFNLKSDLEKLDRKINAINLKHERKRMINITYLIKQILEKYDEWEADKIELNISDDTLDEYEDWFETFQAKQ